MPSRRSSRELKVGLLLLAALGVAGAGILLIGDRRNLFERKNDYTIDFQTVSGLREGNPVQLDGVAVGEVSGIDLPEDPSIQHIRVRIKVGRNYENRIRAGQPIAGAGGRPLPQTRARIKTLGLLGDKYIEISSGAPQYTRIPSGGEIPAAVPTNVDALIASGEDVMGNVVEISHSLSTILGRMERGEGLLGQLTSNSPESNRLRQSMLGTFESAERIANKFDQGDGPLPRLLNDRAMADRLASSLDRFEKILASAESGPGLLPGLLNDPTAKQSFQETLASLRASAGDLQGLTSGLEGSEALLPKLLKDEAYGKEVTDEIRTLIERLNELSLRLTQGEGTAAKLINDPAIYDAVNDVVIGINDSKILRWLIRNRQKAGIEKRAKEARAREAATETAPPSTPEKTLGEPTPEPPPVNLQPDPSTAPPPSAASAGSEDASRLWSGSSCPSTF